MRVTRVVLSVIDVAVWLVVGYLIYQSAGLVFGRLIGQGVLPILIVAILSVTGTCLSIRALGRNLAQSARMSSTSTAFSIWMSRLFLGLALTSLLVWNCYALWAGLDIVFSAIGQAVKIAGIIAFLLYSAWLVFNYKSVFQNCPGDAGS